MSTPDPQPRTPDAGALDRLSMLASRLFGDDDAGAVVDEAREARKRPIIMPKPFHERPLYPHNALSSVSCPGCLWDMLTIERKWADAATADLAAARSALARVEALCDEAEALDRRVQLRRSPSVRVVDLRAAVVGPVADEAREAR